MRIRRHAASSIALLTAACALVLHTRPPAQSPATPAIAGAWEPSGGGRGGAAAGAPPPATPLVLKPEYAKRYDAQRAADAEATKRGEPPPSAAVVCMPY